MSLSIQKLYYQRVNMYKASNASNWEADRTLADRDLEDSIGLPLSRLVSKIEAETLYVCYNVKKERYFIPLR